MYALDATDGGLVWNYPTEGQIYWSSPVLAGGTVFIGSTDGKVYALETATGRRRWSCLLSGQVQGSLAFNAGTVYAGTVIGSTSGRFYAIDAVTGDIRWAYTTRGHIRRGPVVADNTVCIGCEDRNIYAFSTAR